MYFSSRAAQEPAVRQTKRRRTRDVACQTLTYRELRDSDNTTLSTHPNLGGGKHRTQKPSPPRGVAAAAVNSGQPRQRHRNRDRDQQQQHQHSHHHHHHHAMMTPASRGGSMLNPPTSPLSSATTVSTASLYRVTDGGGIVHGAIVRGSRDGARKRPPAQRQARAAAGRGRGGGKAPEGTLDTGVVFPPGEEHAGEAPSAATAEAAADGAADNDPTGNNYGGGGEGSLAPPVDGQGTLLCSPPPSQQRSPSQRQACEREKRALRASPPSRHRRPGTTGDQRASPRLGQVSVSWGQELTREEEEEATGEGQRVEPFTAVGAPLASPSYTRGGEIRAAPRTVQSSDRDVWSAEYQDVEGDYEKSGNRRNINAGGGGFVYEPLSEGPDYRKVNSSVVLRSRFLPRRERER